MSKRILFLYSDIKYKNDISECEAVLKAALRKFRKTVVFSYHHVDLAPSVCNESAADIFSAAEKCDAVIWQSGKDTLHDERIFATNTLKVFAKEQFIGGRCICSPMPQLFTLKDGKNITVQVEFSADNIAKTAVLAAQRSQMRKHSLLLCTDEAAPENKLILREAENSLGKSKAINISYQDFDEMILESIYQIPAFDVLLTTEDKARTITLHISSLQRVPCGSILWHTEKTHFYRREILPREDMSNSAYASFLLSCADAFCNDLNEKSAGDWLRRSTTLALEQCPKTSCSEFLNEVIRQINTPMRSRQVNSDDSKN